MTVGVFKTAGKLVKYATFVQIIIKAVPMFHRIAGRGLRPIYSQINKTNKRNFWSKREIPVQSASNPWGSHGVRPCRRYGPWLAKEMDYWKKWAEVYMQPRTFDAYYARPRSRRSADEMVRTAEVETLKYDEKSFEITLDVQKFEPSELEVKLEGNRLVVRGKHEQRADEHGYVTREFKREFDIPEDVNLETFNSTLSEDGYLLIQAEIKGAEKPPQRTVEIKFQKSE